MLTEVVELSAHFFLFIDAMRRFSLRDLPFPLRDLPFPEICPFPSFFFPCFMEKNQILFISPLKTICY